MTEKPKSKDESSSQGNGGGNKLDYTRYLRMMQETLDKSGEKKTVNRFETEHGKEEKKKSTPHNSIKTQLSEI